MPKLKELEVSYDQIKNLVYQLDFEKRMDLIREVIREQRYRESFYAYTESLAKKYNIPKMSEEELDAFLHERN